MIYTYLNDKYFRSLDDYNKELIAHKSAFFGNCQDFSFSEFVKSLSYNLYCKSSNYRWGKRYFNAAQKDFTWVTSNEKKYIEETKYNYLTGIYEPFKEYGLFYKEDKIRQHFLSCLKSKRKINWYYNLTKFDKKELDNHLTALTNMYMVNKKTFGTTQKMGTDILLVDIDNYEEKHALETLGEFLDICKLKTSDLIFLEQNVFTGGIHLAVKMSSKVKNLAFYNILEEDLKNLGTKIECNFINKILRFPLSYEYVSIKKTDSIFQFDEFIPKEYWEETLDTYVNNLNFKPVNSDYLNNWLMKTNNKEKSWDNYWKTTINRFKRKKAFKTKKEVYKFTCGNRFATMSKVVPFLKYQNYTLDEIVDTIYNNNIDSKDLSKWTKDKLRKNIEKFFNKCSNKVDTIVKLNDSENFFSNIKYLPTETTNFLNDDKFNKWFTDRFIQHYIAEREKHGNAFKSFSNQKKEILYKQIPFILKEIVGKMFYELTSDKQYINKDYNYLLGLQLSNTFLKGLVKVSIEKLNLDTEQGKISLQYLKKALVKSIGLKEISYKDRNRNWMLGSCKSYMTKSFKDLNNILQHLYNSFYHEVITKEFIHYINVDIKNKNNTLYILLEENEGFEDCSNQNGKNPKVPIPKDTS